jgi:acyl carrier protein phosphodiesterase|tara:strand:+ start:31066 stop:31665 length:600 start_codon:yes stop_codon:yes gene_type:complete
MNFLAHLVLSEGGDEVMAGNFFANQAKGNSWKKLPKKYAEGVILHRSIDSYVDNHQIIFDAKKRLSSKFGKFKGVLLDIYWDHFLADGFMNHCGKDRDKFVSYSLKVLKNNSDIFHSNGKNIIEHMEKQNWLNNYSHLDGIDNILCQMSKRFRYTNPLDKGILGLKENYLTLSSDFEILWPDLKSKFGIHPFFREKTRT